LRASILWCRWQGRPALLAVGAGALLLAGCQAPQGDAAPDFGSQVPLPKRALLAPPKEPGCTLDGPGGARPPDDRQATAPGTSLSERIRLEHERNCYQQAELRLRRQLLQLQAAIGRTIASIKRIGRGEP
jgi:hypothetical protein